MGDNLDKLHQAMVRDGIDPYIGSALRGASKLERLTKAVEQATPGFWGAVVSAMAERAKRGDADTSQEYEGDLKTAKLLADVWPLLLSPMRR